MHIGQIMKREEVKRALRPGYGIATRIVDDKRVCIGGEPKAMATHCHEIADNVVGLKESQPGGSTEVIVNVKGWVICNRSEDSVLCRGCLGLS